MSMKEAQFGKENQISAGNASLQTSIMMESESEYSKDYIV